MEWFKRFWGSNTVAQTPLSRDKSRWDVGGWGEETRLLTALDDMAIGGALISLDGRFLRINESLCKLLGYSYTELLESKVQDISGQGDLADWNHLYYLLAKTSNSIRIEKCYQHKAGYPIWVNLTLSLARDSRSHCLLSQFQDITYYKRLEDTSLHSQLLLRGIVEGIPDAVFIKDLEGRYLAINKLGARLYGKTIDEIIGKSDSDIFSSDESQRELEIDRSVIKNGEGKVYELAITTDGMTKVMLFTKTPFLNQRGEILGVVVVARDITDHQRASENLENSRAELRALSARLQSVREEERLRIAREIHDELGQVLTGLKLDLVSFTKKISESLSRVEWDPLKNRSQEIVNLINSAILTVRKISTELRPGLLDAVGLTAAIEWQAKEFENRTGIKCKLKLPHETFIIDQHRSIAIFRIFQEILTNVARHSQATEVSVAIDKNDIELLLEAKDNGRGIRANEFSNPKSLGLLGMRERALLLGGELVVRGIPAKGTIVTLRIPFETRGNNLNLQFSPSLE